MANIYSVFQVNTYIKNMFAQDYMLGLVYVRGEASNVKYHTSGHIYFTLKDEKSQIAAVMFAGNRKGMNFRLEEGMQIVVSGSIEVYDRDGKYQLYAKTVKQDGKGTLAEQFEALKHKLLEMGMFDEGYKRPIPAHVKRLGVVTAPTGAAIRDIINVSKRRNPGIEIVLYPALVQGEQAPGSIIKGIEMLQQYGVDVMIVGRGGGSMEDLWGFNDEGVANAIFNSQVPVISAVGHETDFTIADFVADLRAPTPSAAAELAVCNIEEVCNRIDTYSKRMKNTMEKRISQSRESALRRETLLTRLSPENRLKDNRRRALAIEDRLQALMKERLNYSAGQLAIYIERLKGLSPLDKLKQGYSHTETADGKTVTDISAVSKGDNIRVYVSNGVIDASVTAVSENL